MWIDAHCHLGKKRDNYLKAYELASSLGVKRFLVCCLNMEELRQALILKESGLPIDIALGIHPLISTDLTIELLAQLLKEKEIVALGECGLDFRFKEVDKKYQLHLFKAQIALARTYHKPLIVHSVKATQLTYSYLVKQKLRVLFHAYSGSFDLVKAHQDEDFYYSFGHLLLSSQAKKIQSVASLIPLNKLLIETDASFSGEDKYKHLSSLPLYGQSLATLRHLELKTLIDKLKVNYLNLIGGQ